MEPEKVHPILERYWRENCNGCKNMKCRNTEHEIIINMEMNNRFCLERNREEK